jgi:hypothetical protein
MGKRLTEEDMLDRIDFHGPNGCWLWGGPNFKGYGRVCYAGRYASAHRWVYELCVEPIPDEMELDHICLNPPCCNPDHLEVVTKLENLSRKRPRQSRYEHPSLHKRVVSLLRCRHGKRWREFWPDYVPWNMDGSPRPVTASEEN